MEQNTETWEQWRNDSIGSSDAGIIMGVSDYKTPYELWLERTGRKETDRENFAFMLGHAFEPIIRAKAETRLGEIFEPASIRSKDHPFMHASVDGRNLKGDRLIEIKLNNAEVHAMAKTKGAIPEYHWWQMQHQLLVTGARMCHYISGPYTDNPDDIDPSDLVIITVDPIRPDMDALLEREGEFVEFLANDEPPPLMERDGVQMKSASWKRNAAEYLRYEKQIARLKNRQSLCKERLKQLSGEHPVARGYGVCVKNTLRKGNVNYKAVPELKGVDLDQYRNKSYIVTTFSEDK